MSLGVVGKAYAEYAEDIRQIFCCFNLEKPEQTGTMRRRLLGHL